MRDPNRAIIWDPRYAVREMMSDVARDIEFSSDLSAITRHESFIATVHLITVGPHRKSKVRVALVTAIEQLEYRPWIALALLRELAPSQPKILAGHAGILYQIVEHWIRWAKKHGHITERSHRLLTWIRVCREVTERFDRILATWKGDKKRTYWNKLVRLGKQYPSVVYPIVLTTWALGKLSDDEGHALMAAISGIDEFLLTSIYNAPPGVEPHDPGIEPHDFDPNNRLSSWNEWYRRWAPSVAPYRLWSK